MIVAYPLFVPGIPMVSRLLRVVHRPTLAGRSLLALFIGLACAASTFAQQPDPLLQPAFPNLTFEQITDIQNAGDGTNRLFVTRKTGEMHVFDNDPDVASAGLFLDLSDTVHTESESGLLGLVFHPNFAENRQFFVNYVTELESGQLVTRISRFLVDASNPDVADRSSETIILEVDQPFPNHNGGQLAFGPDGYLYIGLGDGGRWADPFYNAQNLATLLGGMLRIDVDRTEDDRLYRIPEDNPWYGNSKYAGENWAWGLRNPWRFSFDSETGQLWLGDVGQELYEEVNIIERGGNYGWREKEGAFCINLTDMTDPYDDCDSASLIPPIWGYHHSTGNYSITGGYVYRGDKIPSMFGAYFFADFASGVVWRLDYNGRDDIATRELIDLEGNISTFGVDEEGELYLARFYAGEILKFVPDTSLSVDPVTSAVPVVPYLGLPQPHPVTDRMVLPYGLPKGGDVRIALLDILGAEVEVVLGDPREAGRHTIEILTDDLESGTYFVLLEVGEERVVRKVVVQR